MNFQLTTADGEALVFHPLLPPDLLKHQVFPTVFVASGHWGTIIFQVVLADDFSIWYCNFLITKDSSFLIEAEISSIEFYVVLKNNFDFTAIEFERIYVKEGRFNITHLPVIRLNAHFKKGEYNTFNVSFTRNYLQRFSPYLPSLENLLHDIDNKEYSHLLPNPAHTTAGMRQVVNDILKHEYGNGLSRIYLESAILQLLTLAFEKIGKKNEKRLSLNATDIINVEKVKVWLDEHADNPGSLKELANRFNIVEYKLRKGFKELYDTTVFEYLLELRLLNARRMLLETDKKINEIAYLTGYTSNSHFTNAFKKHFGYPPNYLRKNQD